jgi:hypothetical protein
MLPALGRICDSDQARDSGKPPAALARHKRPRTGNLARMPLHVVGAGFGRTGTLSLKAALDDLGFGPTYHMEEVVRRPSHVASWLRYARTGEVSWDDIFSGFGSGVDFPVSCAWEELAAHYPFSKIVLTVRDPQAWWTSTDTTIYPTRTMFPRWLLRLAPVTGQWVEMVDRLVWDGIFDGQFADRDYAVAVFEEFVAHVEATCPPDRLLVFDVTEGWEPLCSFLDVPVPDRPFPRLNDAKSLRRRFTAIRWGTRAAPVVAAMFFSALIRRTAR